MQQTFGRVHAFRYIGVFKHTSVAGILACQIDRSTSTHKSRNGPAVTNQMHVEAGAQTLQNQTSNQKVTRMRKNANLGGSLAQAWQSL